MKELIIISDRREGILCRLGKLFLQYKSCSMPGSGIESYISDNKPGYVFVDFEKPVNGSDMMSILRSVDVNNRLRVTIFTAPKWLSFFKTSPLEIYRNTFNCLTAEKK